ncbi:ArsS family sensor histidine kinase [Halarcobacter anaerophilus]|uniref:histidine kinase n=1 Tax=Halarcobacter anaerophilus TaxID=877500 RepID=A0A4Q0XYW7_9BACT|nr:ArsS family sensor histidine kinase [Halarcobacter anaerophilus]QDF30405.1 two-component system sensor histidine kinase [Halarcobacter anaerophilus]RXJ61509.1 histidine kinase [Halarcobacter anaerophilus]
MSIRRKVSILFVTSLILMIVIGLWMDNINSQRIKDLVKDKYLKVSNEILQNIDNKENIKAIIKNHDLKVLLKRPKKSEAIYYKPHTFGSITILQIPFEDEFIIHIKYLNDEYILQSKDETDLNEKLTLNILVFLDIFVLVIIFLYILKLLSPLKKITKDMEDFSKGNFSSRVDIKSNDEIGSLSKTFNSMADNLEELIKTREELLRDIGHELRTPIAKGKFVIEKFEESSNKELLKKIFLDLERLTNELIQLEKLNSSKLDYSTFSAETLIVESLSRLYMDDESKIDLKIFQDFKIYADLEYLSMALKNLIDNALKYTSRLPIKIEVKENEIKVINKGKRLSKELEYYLKPFTQELSQRDGFGLGLSIVNKVVSKHKFKLIYSYEKGLNIFTLITH